VVNSLIFHVKPLVKVVLHDLNELVDALDELVRVIGRQTNVIIEQSIGRVQALREGLHYRNNKARGKAREWRETGNQLITLAGEQVKGRVVRAKAQARALKDLAWATSLQAYAGAGRSGKHLSEKGRRRRRRRECKQYKGHRRSRTGRLFAV
jgi:hypothetical protein